MKFLTGRPVLAAFFFLAIIVIGSYSFLYTPIELIPDEKLPSLHIQASWRGASADMVMERIALPIEEEVMQIKWVNKLTTSCQENSASIKVEFSRDADMDFVYVLLKERINRLKDKLPPQASLPDVVPYVPEQFTRKPFLTFSVFGETSIFNVRGQVDRVVEPQLRSLNGVQGVKVTGGVPMVIKIIPDNAKLKLLNIQLADIIGAFPSSFYSMASVISRDKGKEITLTLSRTAADIADIENIVIGSNRERPIKLKDTASVFMGYLDMNEEGRYNGQPTVVVDVYKQPLSPSIATAKTIRLKMAQIIKKLSGSLNARVVHDESEELKERLLDLVRISLLILAVIFLILLVTVRDIRAALLIFSSVFFSVFATFTIIYIAKIPLNLLTLSGFALGFGMFVDNAVVVYDNILRQREKGKTALEASIEGPRQVFIPVLASTLTTVIVFFSFAYFQGRLRIYYLPLAQTVGAALLASVVVAFTLIPPLAARMNFRYKPYKAGRGHKAFTFFMRYPLFIILPVAFAVFASYMVFKKEVSFGRFFSWYQKQRIHVWLNMPPGTAFEDTRDAILDFEKIVVARPYEKEATTKIFSNSAFMEVTFPPEIEFSAEPYQLKQELIGLATNMAGVGIGVMGFDPEGYHYSPETSSFLPFTIQVKGYDFERLIRLVGDIKRTLLLNRRIKEVAIQTDDRYYYMKGGKYYSLALDYDAMRRLKIDPRHLYYFIGSTLSGSGNVPFDRLRLGDKEYGIELRLKGSENLELDELMQKEFMTPAAIPFRLSEVSRLEIKEAKGGISRENQEYIAFISWDYLGSSKAGDRFHKAMFKNLELPPGFKKSLDEQRWLMQEEEKFQLVQALVISLFLIFLILAVLYESIWQTLLIMLAIPLGLIGVFLAFVIADFNFDSTAYIGLILLFGVVVNNAIILVDHINLYTRKGMKLTDAIAQGAYERIRPIFMTTATTVLGALPMVIFRQGGQADIWSTLALCTVGGLTSSAILIPFVLPIFYYLFWMLKVHLAGKIRGKAA